MADRILQIMPARTWHAVYKRPPHLSIPLAAWALVEGGDKTSVVGLVAQPNGEELALCGSLPGFLRYDCFDPESPGDTSLPEPVTIRRIAEGSEEYRTKEAPEE